MECKLLEIPIEILRIITSSLQFRDLALLGLCTKQLPIEDLLSPSRLEVFLFLKEHKLSVPQAVEYCIKENNISLYSKLRGEIDELVLHTVAKSHWQCDGIRLEAQVVTHRILDESFTNIPLSWSSNGITTYLRYLFDIHYLYIQGECLMYKKLGLNRGLIERFYSWMEIYLTATRVSWGRGDEFLRSKEISKQEFFDLVFINYHYALNHLIYIATPPLLVYGHSNNELIKIEAVIYDGFVDSHVLTLTKRKQFELAVKYDAYNMVTESVIRDALDLGYGEIIDYYAEDAAKRGIHHNVCKRAKAVRCGGVVPDVIQSCWLCSNRKLE